MKTINRYLLISLGVALFVVAAALGGVSYFVEKQQTSEQELARRFATVEERARAQEEPFHLALRRLELARDDALARLEGTSKADSPIRFGHDTDTREDGSIRLRQDRFDPKWDPGVFVPSGVTLDEDIKHRIVSFRDTTNFFGQAWRKDFPNLWFAGPEGWVVAYWPAYAWTEKMGANDKPAVAPWFIQASPEKNAARKPVWSIVRTDPGGKTTSVVLSLPLYVGNTFLGVVAEDVPLGHLDEVVSVADADAGITRVVFGPAGAVLASTGRADEIAKAGGSLKAEDEPKIASAIAAIQAHGEAAGRVRDATGKQHVLYATMGKLPWTMMTLIPDGKVGGGMRSALIIAGAALLGMLLVMGLMARQVRAGLVTPLKQLAGAVASIAHGHADVVLPTSAKGEIAELADSLIPMRDSVASKLEAAKAEKSALVERLAAAEEKAEQTQRRLDEETVVAEDRANRLKDLEQRYEALMQQQMAAAGEEGSPAAEGDGAGEGQELADAAQLAADEAQAAFDAAAADDSAEAMPLEINS